MKYIHYSVLVISVMVFFVSCGDQASKPSTESNATPTETAQKPTPAPEEPLTSADVDEEKIASSVDSISLEQLQDIIGNRVSKPLFLNFWATWCSPCIKEMPHINDLYDKYQMKRIDFLSVSADHWTDTVSDVPKLIKKLEMHMPVKVLKESDADKVIRSIDPEWRGDLPATFIYSATGQMVKKFFGAQEKESFEQAILAVMGAE